MKSKKWRWKKKPLAENTSLKGGIRDAEEKTVTSFEAKIDNNSLKKLQMLLKITILKTKVNMLKGYQCSNILKSIRLYLCSKTINFKKIL